ncbi:MAG: hypothetical protein KGM94_21860 [Bradyrhizobium sp.]|nr:hypothetical protein [Bradyrhizobium sp.]
MKLPASDCVLYPSKSLHLVTPARRRLWRRLFSCYGAWYGHDQARSLIFDLDTAVQALAERLGRDDPETVKLTGLYHNLIRTWAEA